MLQKQTPAARLPAPARFLPAALWYALIFWFSSRDAISSGGQSDGLMGRLLRAVSPAFRSAVPALQSFAVETLSFPIRKCAHMFLYFILTLLLLYALARFRRTRSPALALCALLAALDEFHQTFVPGRSGELRDVLVDLCGGAAALALWSLVLWLRQKPAPPSKAPLALPALLVPAALLLLIRCAGPLSAALAKDYVASFSSLDGPAQAALLSGAAPVFRDTAAALACGLFGLSAWIIARFAKARPRAVLALAAGAAALAALACGLSESLPPLSAALLTAAGWALTAALWALVSLLGRPA